MQKSQKAQACPGSFYSKQKTIRQWNIASAGDRDETIVD